MGTEYKLYEDDSFGELTIDESSNKLNFWWCAEKDNSFNYYSKQMPPEKMAKIFLEGLTVCSYWMDTDELKQMIQEHLENKIY